MRMFFYFINRNLLGRCESIFSPSQCLRLSHPPIFVLGSPRSGSTLAVQLITETLDIGYMSNRHAQWFGWPAIAEHFFHPTSHRQESGYQSYQGKTREYFEPAESGEWWYRFFSRDPTYVTLSDINHRHMCKFRKSVASLIRAFGKPVIFKNLYASLRVQAIAHYLPESIFIVMNRHEVDNGHSILEARYKNFQNYEQWFSVKPPNIEKIKLLPSYKQVIEQIRSINSTIEKDIIKSGISKNIRFDISYEELCANPGVTVRELQNFLRKNGYTVKRRGCVPKNFVSRKDIRIDSSVYKKMSEYSKIKHNV